MSHRCTQIRFHIHTRLTFTLISSEMLRCRAGRGKGEQLCNTSRLRCSKHSRELYRKGFWSASCSLILNHPNMPRSDPQERYRDISTPKYGPLVCYSHLLSLIWQQVAVYGGMATTVCLTLEWAESFNATRDRKSYGACDFAGQLWTYPTCKGTLSGTLTMFQY